MKLLKLSFLLLFFGFIAANLNAQEMESKEALEAQLAEKAAALAALQGEVSAIQGKIAKIPGWRKGFVGVAGLDFNGNNNWFAVGSPNSASNGIGIGINAFANNIQEKFFWRNLLNITFQRTATKLDKSDDSGIIALSEGLDLSSLYGYRLNSKWAISAEGKYTTSIISYNAEDNKYSSSINNPGKLIFSAGATWTPIENLVVLIHPLGYELNFPGELISSPGAKVGAVYAAKLYKGISWTSNLSVFIPYTAGNGEVNYTNGFNDVTQLVTYETSDLLNYTWLNGFSMKIFNGITVALNVGMRGDNQIADKGQYALAVDQVAVDAVKAKGLGLQSYYTLGFGYTF